MDVLKSGSRFINAQMDRAKITDRQCISQTNISWRKMLSNSLPTYPKNPAPTPLQLTQKSVPPIKNVCKQFSLPTLVTDQCLVGVKHSLPNVSLPHYHSVLPLNSLFPLTITDSLHLLLSSPAFAIVRTVAPSINYNWVLWIVWLGAGGWVRRFELIRTVWWGEANAQNGCFWAAELSEQKVTAFG